MKKTLSVLACAAMLVALATSCNSKGNGKSGSNDPINDSISIAFGHLQGSALAKQMAEDSVNKIDIDAYLKGFEFALNADTTTKGMSMSQGLQMAMQLNQMLMQAGDQLPGFDKKKFFAEFKKALTSKKTLTQEQLMKLQEDFQALAQRAEEKRAEKDPIAVANKKKGDTFLDNKVKKEGFKTTKSGIAYKMTEEGSGDTFKDTDRIDVVYTGKHVDGTEFDSSNGKPTTFSPTGVVKGFGEMLKMMKPGAKATVIIPASLGYGPRGQQPKIGPNETLVFEIETKGVHQLTPEEKKQQEQMQKMMQQQAAQQAAKQQAAK